MKNQKYRTVFPLGDGSYLTKELPGPSTFQAWLGCWRVFKSAALMLNICTLASLTSYERFVERLNNGVADVLGPNSSGRRQDAG